MAASFKAKKAWKTLMAFYGARLSDNYGPQPPEEWCELIDRCDGEQLDRAMTSIRREHVNFPPTLGQFEAATKKPLRSGRQQSPVDRLTEFIVEHRQLTVTQLRGPWSWLEDSDGAVTGVVIRADGEAPGYRVMMADMAAGA